jgi:hypothetical protein
MVATQNKARKSLRLRREPAGSVQKRDSLVIGKKASSFQLLVAIQSAAAK